MRDSYYTVFASQKTKVVYGEKKMVVMKKLHILNG